MVIPEQVHKSPEEQPFNESEEAWVAFISTLKHAFALSPQNIVHAWSIGHCILE
jgi:hypothetical protein